MKLIKAIQPTLLLIVILFSCSEHKTNISFFDRLQPVPLNSGFKMDDYWIWGGSVIKVKSTYHLFAARWPKDQNFPQDYRNQSEIVRATADNILGPYTFQEIVIGERDSSFWDSNMAHNPTIHKHDDEFILFYIGSDFTTKNPDDPKSLHRCIGYATATSIEGPWKRSDKPIIKGESNNPAVFIEPTGEVKLIFRDAPLRVYLATALSYKGPYTVVNDNVWPQCPLEDFYLFKHQSQYHCIIEDNEGEVSGHERWGVNLFSQNGISDWRKYDPVVMYDHDLKYDDGSVLHCTRRERPQLFIEDGKVLALFTGIYDGENSWCQPVLVDPSY